MESTISIEEDNHNNVEDGRSSENLSDVHEQQNIYPYIGLEFDSLEEVKNFYTSFAKNEGFGIRTRSTKTNLCILVCSNAGLLVSGNNNEESNTITGKGSV
ncbi:hypothetical protein P8452_65054 [Trifolium repens]|nr:hypothetical protein P8452_65054 [Trifolium repens]